MVTSLFHLHFLSSKFISFLNVLVGERPQSPFEARLHLRLIFVALLYATFLVPEFRDKNCKSKLAAISQRFVAAMSQRFEACSKLHATLCRFGSKHGTSVGTELHWNRSKFTLATKDAIKVQQKSHQKSHV